MCMRVCGVCVCCLFVCWSSRAGSTLQMSHQLTEVSWLALQLPFLKEGEKKRERDAVAAKPVGWFSCKVLPAPLKAKQFKERTESQVAGFTALASRSVSFFPLFLKRILQSRMADSPSADDSAARRCRLCCSVVQTNNLCPHTNWEAEVVCF